jgi:hypothetical protein
LEKAVKPEQKLTLTQIRDELPQFEYRVQNALRFYDNAVYANQSKTELLIELENMVSLINHFINYEDK